MIKYPARYEKESDTMYFLRFIDFPGAVTQGKDMNELAENARDVLSLALSFELNHDYVIPPPSPAEGDDIVWVEPFPEIRQRMGHKKGCECPVCRNARGEREKITERFEVRIPSALKAQVKEYCQRHKISEGKVTVAALEKFLEKSS